MGMSNSNPQEIVRRFEIADEEVRFYEREGYLILPGALSEVLAIQLRCEILEMIERERPPYAKLQQTKEYFAGGLIDAFIHSPNLLAVAERLMGGKSKLHSPFTAVKAAGGGRFHFHQDNQYTEFNGPGINMWLAAEEVGPHNGTLQIIPQSHEEGTHKWVLSGDGDEYRKVDFEPDFHLPLRLRAGDLVTFNRLTVHGSGPNHSQEHRVGYAVQFHREDTKALIDGEWVLLKDHPRFDLTPLER
jgi:2-oxoglutarate-dependent dioxygenase